MKFKNSTPYRKYNQKPKSFQNTNLRILNQQRLQIKQSPSIADVDLFTICARNFVRIFSWVLGPNSPFKSSFSTDQLRWQLFETYLVSNLPIFPTFRHPYSHSDRSPCFYIVTLRLWASRASRFVKHLFIFLSHQQVMRPSCVTCCLEN